MAKKAKAKPTEDQLRAAALRYLEGLNCSFWGFQGSVFSDERRATAADWLVPTMAKVLDLVE